MAAHRGGDAELGSDVLVERFPPQRAAVFLALVVSAVAIGAGALEVVGVIDGEPVGVPLGVLGVTVFSVVAWVLSRLSLLAPTLLRTSVETPRPFHGWTRVALDDVAGVAIVIADHVTGRQGPNGLLITTARQVTAPNPGGYETAYWSPDGRTGPL